MKQCLSLFIFICLAACGTLPPPTTLPTPHVVIETMTPLPTETLTPTSTPVTIYKLIFPYTIQGLREHSFQSGPITVLSTLNTTDEYTNYLISYPSDGLTITGVMQIPAGEGPFPVIMMNHGYADRGTYASGDGTDRAAEFLVKRGYITLSSDYRSWGGSEVGPSLFHTGLVIDVINLMNAIPSIPQADPSRIGMWGHSMGGGITTKILAVDPRVGAAVLYAPNSADDADLIARWGYGCIGEIPVVEPLETCNPAEVIPVDLPPELIHAYEEAAVDPSMLEQIASIHHLDTVIAPVQIHIGTADGDTLGSTPPEWSYKLHQSLLAAGKPSELYTYEGERHSFIGDQWLLFMTRAVYFFDKNVKNTSR
ncbi:MAG TPA: alpha/beta fold hydrolase [Anaerolineales bacterium]|nr:alpha/beta fold hydrolase [Anaerolineales bacterium]